MISNILRSQADRQTATNETERDRETEKEANAETDRREV